MNRESALAAEIRSFCKTHADPAGAARYARYFKEGYDSWGLMDGKHPLFNEKQTEWQESYSGLGLRGFLRLGDLLFQSGKYEEGALAIRFVSKFRDSIGPKEVASIGNWFQFGIGNWAHTDVLCSEILAPLLEQGRIGLEAISVWRNSPLKYQRRAVPVAMLGLLKAEAGVEPLLDFLRPLMLDPERVVEQGLGWFLREAWKKQPEPVERFLLEWKDQAPRLIFQYATEKMPLKDRARFRRAKAGKSSR